MHAEVIAIGDEITGGQLLDTNSQWLSQRLAELGIRTLYHSAVGDDLDAGRQVFQLAFSRADVVVATGGLGPTADDLTRQSLADALGRPLELRPEALEHIRQLFARRNRPMPEQNRLQALFPEGSEIIPNPHGTAPGVLVRPARAGRSPCLAFALPGVPAEMRQMFAETVVPTLREAGAGERVIRRRNIKCFGVGESQVEAMLPDLIRRGRTPAVGINASQTTIILRIVAEGASEAECDALVAPTVETIHQCLGELVFGEGDDELQNVVLRTLGERKQTLATAEWGTAGLLADWLGSVPEADGSWRGGAVVRDALAAERSLGIAPEALAARVNAPATLVEAMARACRDRFGAHLGLAIGPFPPFLAEAEQPELVHVALATPETVAVTGFPFAGHPATLRVLMGKRALNVVRLHLMHDRLS